VWFSELNSHNSQPFQHYCEENTLESTLKKAINKNTCWNSRAMCKTYNNRLAKVWSAADGRPRKHHAGLTRHTLCSQNKHKLCVGLELFTHSLGKFLESNRSFLCGCSIHSFPHVSVPWVRLERERERERDRALSIMSTTG